MFGEQRELGVTRCGCGALGRTVKNMTALTPQALSITWTKPGMTVCEPWPPERELPEACPECRRRCKLGR